MGIAKNIGDPLLCNAFAFLDQATTITKIIQYTLRIIMISRWYRSLTRHLTKVILIITNKKLISYNVQECTGAEGYKV